MTQHARFHECSIPSITYLRGEVVTNDPVNMMAVWSMKRSRLNWYSDNTGRPALTFLIGHTEVTWVFNTEAERDAEYQRILDKFP